MERFQENKPLSLEQLLEKNLMMVKNNRFLTPDEKEEKRKKLLAAHSVEDVLFKALIKNPSVTFRGRGSFVNMALRKLSDIDIEAFKQCYDLSQPVVSNRDLIPTIIERAALVYPKNLENYPIIIAVCYYLIAPFKNVYHDVKMEPGIRDKISNALGFNNPESVNAYSGYIPPNFKNPRFKAKVCDLGDYILEELRAEGLLTREEEHD